MKNNELNQAIEIGQREAGFQTALKQAKMGALPQRVGQIITLEQFYEIASATAVYMRKHGYAKYVSCMNNWRNGLRGEDLKNLR